MTYVTLKMDGTFAVHQGIPTLAQLQAAVGGYVEVREIKPDGLTMWCHEEAKYPWQGLGGSMSRKELESPLATWFLTEAGYDDWIAGDVVFTGGPDEEGETLGLTDEQTAWLREKLTMRAVIASDFSGMVRGREVPA